MCINATVAGSTVTYELESTGSQTLGWMAVGFGSQMANTPMVIMWPNPDGTIVLSQRQAPAEVLPTPVPSPARVATVQQDQSLLTGSKPKLVFTVELDGAPSKQPHIWAFGGVQPGASPDSAIQQHIDSGPFQLDLAGTLALNTANLTNAGTRTANIPFKPYQKIIIVHASLCAFGFLVLLPSGIFLARFTRTWNNKWFTGHWIIQGGAGAATIIVGILLGFLAVHEHGVDIPSRHKTIGKVLLVLYILQCSLGAFIHFVKIRFRFGRPPQNYTHAVLGLVIVGLSLYQIRLGYSVEWPTATGRPPLGTGVNIIWWIWTILLVLFYAGGLFLLPRQWRQERASRKTVEKPYHHQSDDDLVTVETPFLR